MAAAAAVTGTITDVRKLPFLGDEKHDPRTKDLTKSRVFTTER
jgi:hypothetical protein